MKIKPVQLQIHFGNGTGAVQNYNAFNFFKITFDNVNNEEMHTFAFFIATKIEP